ncbi:MAG: hypothetical protein Q7R83_02905 [bacterium]|nr:hypothetical protein [bacterium]
MNRAFTWLASVALLAAAFGSLCPTCLAGMPVFPTPTVIAAADAHCDHTEPPAPIVQSNTHTWISGCAMPPAPLLTIADAQATHDQRTTLQFALVPTVVSTPPADVYASPQIATRVTYRPQAPPLVGTTIKKE